MMEILIPVLAMSLLAAAMAAVLVVSEKKIYNYGPCKMTINDKKELTVEGGRTLLSSLKEKKIFIPSACGGRGTCGVCKLKVLDGAGDILPTETSFMSPAELENKTRLSCQVRIRKDIRIAIPEELFSVRQFASQCTAIEDLTYDMKRFRFELVEPQEIQFAAGQYVQINCPAYKPGQEEVSRAYSIASDPTNSRIVELIVRRVPNGICTEWMFDFLKVGDTAQFTGPYGEFRLSGTESPMVFIAGGSGMAPFVSILYAMYHTGSKRKTEYFFGGNGVRDLCLLEQMADFEKKLLNFRFIPVVAKPSPQDNWQGSSGLVTEAVRKSIADLSAYEGYLCGSPGMIDASIKVLTELGMAKDKIYYDKFA